MSWIKTDVEAGSKERIARPEFIVQQLLRVVLTAPPLGPELFSRI